MGWQAVLLKAPLLGISLCSGFGDWALGVLGVFDLLKFRVRPDICHWGNESGFSSWPTDLWVVIRTRGKLVLSPLKGQRSDRLGLRMHMLLC